LEDSVPLAESARLSGSPRLSLARFSEPKIERLFIIPRKYDARNCSAAPSSPFFQSPANVSR